MGGKRPDANYVTASVNAMMLTILFLQSIQSHDLSRNPYNSVVAQLEPPLAMPYIERRSDISDQERNTRGYWLQYPGAPQVLQRAYQDVSHDDLTDYTGDYGNLLEDMPANSAAEDRYSVSREPLVDLPTGIPESVSNRTV
jgi:hypothetical protein